MQEKHMQAIKLATHTQEKRREEIQIMTKAHKATKANANVAANVTSDYLAAMLSAFDSRAAYEAAKNSENSNMQETLKDLKKSVNHDAIANVMQSANLDCAFINRQERNNARFNVYAAQKIVNIARAAKHVATLNHYTKAIVASLASFKAASAELSHKDAISACSSDSKVSKAKDALLVRYAKITSANTASTQASSSLNALLACHVISESRNAANETCYTLNDNALASDLIALCA